MNFRSKFIFKIIFTYCWPILIDIINKENKSTGVGNGVMIMIYWTINFLKWNGFLQFGKFSNQVLFFMTLKWSSKYCQKYEKFLSPNEPKNTCNEWCIAISIKYSLNLSTKIAPGNKQSDRSKTCLVFYGIQSSSEKDIR